ncbi:MAG: hypothetical protein HYS68_02030 [Candidatus Levybacteria bacterium]|nr:hypothetical protein [Candidatus Levybacteria bacterium]
MNPRFSLDKGVYKVLYERYREYIVPLLIIFVCTVLIVGVVIPQVQDFLATVNATKELRSQIAILKKNVQFLTGLDPATLDLQLGIASSALPPEKDFAGILNAVTTASARSGASLGDFSFAVGELSTKSAQLAGQPSIQVALTVSGDVFFAKRFIQELSKTMPLSEVLNAAVSGKSSSLTTVFYYKVFSPIQFDGRKPLSGLSQNEEQLLNKLSSWGRGY